MRIVLLDTDKTIKDTLSEKCQGSGAKLEVFFSVDKAFAAVAKDPENIDVVLICREIENNDVLGLELARRLRSDDRVAEVPFIILSSKLSNADFAKHQNTSDGANAYLRKPVAPAQLVATIESVTGLKFPVIGANKSGLSQKRPPSLPELNVVLVESSKIIDLAEKTATGLTFETSLKIFPDELPAMSPSTLKISLPVLEPRTGFIDTNKMSREAPPMPPEKPVVLNSVPEATAAAEALITRASDEMPAVTQVQTTGDIDISLGGSVSLQLQSSSGNEMQANATTEPASQINIEPNVTPATPEEITVEEPAVVASSPVIENIVIDTEEPKQNTNEKDLDAAAAQDLPYLFGGGLGNAAVQGVVSTGLAASHDLSEISSDHRDVETLKKYLMMREQDAAILSAQLSYAKEELSKSDQSIKRLTMEVETVNHQVDDKNKRIETLEQQLLHAGKSQEGEIEQLRFELKSKIDRTKFLEDQLANSAAQYEKLRDRVRLDIRKIRVREKELENKLEILKKDSETLIAARESKILELKRKIDLLEFNYDTLQDQNESEKANVSEAHEKIAKVVKVLKLAMGIIEGETDIAQTTNENDLKIA